MEKHRLLIVRREEEVKPRIDVCGLIRVPILRDESPEGNLVTVEVRKPTVPHFHKEAVETYYNASMNVTGGMLLLGDHTFHFSGGTTARIPPMTAHQLIPQSTIDLVVMSVPAWSLKDHFPLAGNNPEVGYGTDHERAELILELLRRSGREQRERIDSKNTLWWMSFVSNPDPEAWELTRTNRWDTMSLSDLRCLL